ncbi:hypothetical protein RHGRI_008718 [Rhododendron griersonianum]|uniref:Uncharacterized protein n=1 Tax=Rhododendron griersonianum TaxID=479676 RepID=A0AAV6L2J2_9ERIC|nr:hypothetical protein RHGRI_008718 [Rhododendron griersonianum]
MHMLDFFSICEVMELVPEGEVESSAQACPNSFADGRANKLEIKERKERQRSTKASALSTTVEVEEEDVLGDDGEEEREAFDLLEMLKLEEEMLSSKNEKQLQVRLWFTRGR